MIKNGFLISLVFVATTWTFGCAPAPTGQIVDGETCSEDRCSETDLNAPTNGDVETPSYSDGISSGTVQQGQHSHVDPSKLVPAKILAQAMKYFDVNFSKIPNKRWVAIADMSQHSSKARLYLIDMATGKVTPYHVAHGKNSDMDSDGYATTFSNTPDSKMSSMGFYLTAETYVGNHGYSMRLDGLQSTNSNARDRAIVVHPADYVSERDQYAGKSWGCPAMDPEVSRLFIDKVKNGALYYIYYNQ